MTGEVPLVRDREPGDLPALVVLLREVHERDRYPVRWPADPAGFLEPVDGLSAWVAELSGTVVGHVMLTGAQPDVAAALGVADGEVALVSRLFVGRAARGLSAGSRLLAAAADAARSTGRRLALEVLSLNTDAVAVYERSGWIKVG